VKEQVICNTDLDSYTYSRQSDQERRRVRSWTSLYGQFLLLSRLISWHAHKRYHILWVTQIKY